jgi:hypothetical protein
MAVDGTYNYEASTPIGKQKGKFVFKTQGKTLSGTSTSSMGSDNITDGVVEGDTLKFKLNTKGPTGRMNLDFTLALNGDKDCGGWRNRIQVFLKISDVCLLALIGGLGGSSKGGYQTRPCSASADFFFC